MDAKDENRKERVNCFTLLGSEPKAICFSIAVGKAIDNIVIERFWRSLKYEDIYLQNYNTLKEARAGIGKYIELYNKERLHSDLDYDTPDEVYFKGANNYKFDAKNMLLKIS